MMQRPLFGTAGLSASFSQQGFKKMWQVPQYLAGFGLGAFEYQCGRGVRLAEQTAAEMVKEGEKHGIVYSLHAPYYISMSSMKEETRLGSLRYFLQSAQAVRMLGGSRVVFHAGSCGGQSREQALSKAKDTLARARHELDEAGFWDIYLCPETMGKQGQLGTLDEVLQLCKSSERCIPCIDFGHLNARSGGAIKGIEDYEQIVDAIGEALGEAATENFHVHFSKIEYSAGGEKRHLTFEDECFGPQPQPLMQLFAQRGIAPTVICESDGTQAEDAQTMQRQYEQEAQ